MSDPVGLLLDDLDQQYSRMAVSASFTRLYASGSRFDRMFAGLHQRLNEHFESINERSRTTRHYWAESSREMLLLIDEVANIRHSLNSAGSPIALVKSYTDAIAMCRAWLVASGGSTIPEEFVEIPLVKYEPVFYEPEKNVRLRKSVRSIPMQLIGEGSYATVFSFVDPDYGIKVAVKRAKKNISDQDLLRFRREFDVLKSIRFPYIVEVYQFDNARNEYQMEYCEETLRGYINRRNSSLSFAARKRIALQFLYGVNYIHFRKYLHRDISLQNVLVKVFDDSAAMVKLSDFGLVKDRASQLTRTHTGMQNTITDPQLGDFKLYDVVNEIYSVGRVISFIFSGRESLDFRTVSELNRIVRKCTSPDLSQRYSSILDLVADVERMPAEPADSSA